MDFRKVIEEVLEKILMAFLFYESVQIKKKRKKNWHGQRRYSIFISWDFLTFDLVSVIKVSSWFYFLSVLTGKTIKLTVDLFLYIKGFDWLLVSLNGIDLINGNLFLPAKQILPY